MTAPEVVVAMRLLRVPAILMDHAVPDATRMQPPDATVHHARMDVPAAAICSVDVVDVEFQDVMVAAQLDRELAMVAVAVTALVLATVADEVSVDCLPADAVSVTEHLAAVVLLDATANVAEQDVHQAKDSVETPTVSP